MTPERWSRVKEVLQGALDLDSGERAAFLQQACGEDTDLRTRVEELLISDQNNGEFLETPAIDLAGDAEPSGETASVAPDEAIPDAENVWGESPVGRRIGPY